jgi:hypothetical protein
MAISVLNCNSNIMLEEIYPQHTTTNLTEKRSDKHGMEPQQSSTARMANAHKTVVRLTYAIVAGRLGRPSVHSIQPGLSGLCGMQGQVQTLIMAQALYLSTAKSENINLDGLQGSANHWPVQLSPFNNRPWQKRALWADPRDGVQFREQTFRKHLKGQCTFKGTLHWTLNTAQKWKGRRDK